MSQTFRIKRGDTSPALQFALFPKSVVLTGAAVRFQMENANRQTVIDAPAEVVEATGNPAVAYEWQPGDTDIAGEYQAEFRVEYIDGTIETFPNHGFIGVHIGRDVQDITP